MIAAILSPAVLCLWALCSHPCPPPLRFAALAAITLIWGSTWAAIRLELEGMPPFAVAALRFAVAAVLLMGFASFRRLPLGRSRREVALRWVNGLLTFVLGFARVAVI